MDDGRLQAGAQQVRLLLLLFSLKCLVLGKPEPPFLFPRGRNVNTQLVTKKKPKPKHTNPQTANL